MMNKDELLKYAQSEMERLHNDPLLIEYFDEINICLMMLKIFQYITIGIVAIVFLRFNTFEHKEYWKVNRVILMLSAFLLCFMIVYELINYKSMSGGFDGVPLGFQFIILLVVVYFLIRKKS